MARTYIAGAENSPVYYELESALLAAGGEVVGEADAASAILTIQSERYGRRVLSVDSAGRASEYELSLRLDYSLSTPEGEPLAQRDTVTLLRDYRFDPDNVLASGSQESTLQNEMRRYAVRQILRRLQSIDLRAHPATGSSPGE
jgi:LPS-assembly lipoprotein